EEIKIKVLNGSGTAGKATEVKDLLSEKGYQEILTANADSFDYEETVVQFKKETKDAAQLLKKDLEDSGATFKDEVLEEDSASDIILIIGADFK
ncbi:MAG: LytR C-terminal domain-containing protein, partial [Patescibacteria group bacterium]